jgi:hypothetical protein
MQKPDVKGGITEADEQKLDDILKEIQEMKDKLNKTYMISIALLVIFVLLVLATLLLPSS